MRVLITNTAIDLRGGAELRVQDLARGLQQLGHSVIAFSSDSRQCAHFLENDLVPVATDVSRLTVRPDVIHAQHHLDAVTALAALPEVPAIYHSHGAVWPVVPRHPRIYGYLANSQAEADRLESTGVTASDVRLWRQPLATARVGPIRARPRKPRRALFAEARSPQNDDLVTAASDAAARCGVALDFLHPLFDRRIDRVQELFASYDIVFTLGAPVVEALACGCAVVVLGRTGGFEMVTSDNYARLEQNGFLEGVGAASPSVHAVETEIRRYSADDCERVANHVRSDADFGSAIAELVGFYQETIDRHRVSRPDARADLLATSAYLRQIIPTIRSVNAELAGHWAAATRANTFYDLRARVSLLEQRLSGVGLPTTSHDPSA